MICPSFLQFSTFIFLSTNPLLVWLHYYVEPNSNTMKKYIYFTIYISLALIIWISCKKEDANPVSITITSPLEGEEFQLGTTITIVAEDEGNNISEVRFYIDNIGKSSVSSFPYNYEWNTTGEVAGYHTIKVTAYDNNDNEDSYAITISLVEYTPVADFTCSPEIAKVGEDIQFNDISSNNPTSWLWDFGDGSTSSLQNPTHSYSYVGYYTISLTSSNNEGSDTKIITNCITVHDIAFNPSLNYSTVNDIEGNTYKTIQIGTQIWMAENLKTTRFNDSTPIQMIEDNSAWASLSSPAYCWHQNDINNKVLYGALYNWYTVESDKLCPTGWHTPDDDEWLFLIDHLGGYSTAGGKLKEVGTTHWFSPNTAATNESGFTALPSSYRLSVINSGTFEYLGVSCIFWSRDESDSEKAFGYGINHANSVAVGYSDYKGNGCSVRCIKD